MLFLKHIPVVNPNNRTYFRNAYIFPKCTPFDSPTSPPALPSSSCRWNRAQLLGLGALKAMAEGHLSDSDDLCPMKYFEKWYLEVQVGHRKKLMGIDEGITLAAARLEDESFVHLEGPMFEEGEAKVGMAEMGRQFDAMAAKQLETQSEALDNVFRQQYEATEEQFEALDNALKKQSDKALKIGKAARQTMKAIAKAQSDANAKIEVMLLGTSDKFQVLSAELKQVWDWTMMQPMNHCADEVDSLLQKHSNRPLKALWEVLNDEANLGIELPMAIVMDRRCGIELRAALADGPMKGGGEFIINGKDYEGATPLTLAVHAGLNDVVSDLLANGADFKATFGAISLSALRIAAFENNVEAIELLASYGADVSKPSRSNSTPLHDAAYNGQAAAIEALVRLGADLAIVDNMGNTPLQYFVDKPHRQHTHLSKAEKRRLKALLTPKA